MRIVVEKKASAVKGLGLTAPEVTISRKVAFGREDLVLVFMVALILVGLAMGKLAFDQALAFIGVSTSGGVWGLLSGNASDKK